MSDTTGRRGIAALMPLFVLAHFTHHIITAVAAPLLPLIRTSFDLNYTTSGLLLTAFTLAYGLGHLPSGWLTGRVNPLLMIFFGIGGIGIGGLLFGLAPTYSTLVAANAIIGVAGSGYHPAASYLIGRIARPENRGRALGMHVIGGSGAYFAAPLLAGVMALGLGWRNTYIALAIPTTVLGLVFVLLLRPRIRAHAAAQKEHASPAVERGGARFWVWLTAFLVLSAISGALVGSVIGFIPLMLVDFHGMREEAAAGLLALIFSGGFWVSPLAGHISDKVGKVPLLLGASVMVIPVIYFLPRIAPGLLFYVLLVLTGVFIFVRMPVSEAFLFQHAPSRSRSTLLGVYFLGASSGGGVFTPLIGRIADVQGFERSFLMVAAAILAVTLVCGLILAVLRGEEREGEKTAAPGEAKAGSPTG